MVKVPGMLHDWQRIGLQPDAQNILVSRELRGGFDAETQMFLCSSHLDILSSSGGQPCYSPFLSSIIICTCSPQNVSGGLLPRAHACGARQIYPLRGEAARVFGRRELRVWKSGTLLTACGCATRRKNLCYTIAAPPGASSALIAEL